MIIPQGLLYCSRSTLKREILKGLSLALHAVAAALAAAYILCGDFWPREESTGRVTLVTLKVKLSN